MKKILVVEDEDYLREIVCSLLKGKGYETSEAPNGKVAREVLHLKDFDVILSDVQMPHLSGIELLEWNMKNKSIPFVLMTGFSHILETQSAFDLGAVGFLTKPFEESELFDVIDRIAKKNEFMPSSAKESSPEEFCKVSLNEFVSDKKLEIDVFIKLSDKKIIKIGRKGDNIPTNRIESYKSKGLKYLHVLKSDFGNLVKFNLDLAKKVGSSHVVNSEKKKNFMRYTGELILEHAFTAEIDEEMFTEAKDFLSTSIDVLTESNEAFSLLEHLNSHCDYLYAHALCASMYATMIARKMGYESSALFFKLSMAGLFHDIGKKEIDRELLDKPRPLLNYQERSLVESHPQRGFEILSQLKNVPSDVLTMVLQHHENCMGTGYPQRLKKDKIHPLAKILITANIFSELVIVTPHHKGMSGRESIKEMETHYSGLIDSQSFNALKSIFRVA